MSWALLLEPFDYAYMTNAMWNKNCDNYWKSCIFSSTY